MAITAGMVKELREMTGAGMMDCKKALTETDGNMEAAVELLRKSGAAKMAKKAARIAAEGICRVAVDGGKAVVVEVNSETDFVAKNEVFQTFVQSVADTALAAAEMGGKNGEDVQALLDAGLTDELADKTLKIGEKLSFRRFAKVEGECVASYIHGGGRIGVLVSANGASDEAAKTALTNVAMQIAAMNPQYIAREDISADELAKLKEITIDSALNDPASLPKPIQAQLFEKAYEAFSADDKAAYDENKNSKYLFNFLSEEAKAKLAELAMADKENIMANKIFAGLAEGRVAKQLKDITLLEQVYVRAEDGKQTVKAYLASVNKALVLTNMIRFEVGEGMEKKNEDFAAEVAAQ
ncbi:MAG: translation elongation factor Ts, partial [Lachnospiraceae bacterium]|nr:translation elongation factor Ts [Lachnospiraceae bacterium]